MAEAGTLKLDFRALKSQNPFFFLRIPFYTLWSYYNCKNPVGPIDTLKQLNDFDLALYVKNYFVDNFKLLFYKMLSLCLSRVKVKKGIEK